jgi:hypothetical protein
MWQCSHMGHDKRYEVCVAQYCFCTTPKLAFTIFQNKITMIAERNSTKASRCSQTNIVWVLAKPKQMISVCSFFWHIRMALVSSHNFRTQFLLLNLKLCRSDTKIQGPINPKLQLQQPTCTLLQLWWNFRTAEMSKTTASWVLQTELYPGLDASYSRFSCEFSSEVGVRVAPRNKE